MRDRGLFIVGGALILVGMLIFLSNLFSIDLWAVCFPIAIILVGIWMLFQPRLSLRGADVNIRPLGDIRRKGAWSVRSEEIFIFVGNVRLDFSQAEIPPGETIIRVYGFVGDVKLHLPEIENLGFSISSIGFVNDTRIFGNKRQTILSPIEYQSDGFVNAERKIRISLYYFVVDMDVYPS